jgi:hypothetical protein
MYTPKYLYNKKEKHISKVTIAIQLIFCLGHNYCNHSLRNDGFETKSIQMDSMMTSSTRVETPSKVNMVLTHWCED